MRSLFQDAKKTAPSIIFIDEIDAIGHKRSFRKDSTNQQTLNQMLTLMDGFEDANVLVIAATNAEEKDLDRAMLRSGRFDKKVRLHLPFKEDRIKLFEFYLRRVPSGTKKERLEMATAMGSMTWGSSGADIANVVNQAAIHAVNRSAKKVNMQDLQNALGDVQMGPESKSLKISDKEKLNTAYHEAGHTIVALYTPHAQPPRQVTIVPRANALGAMTPDVQDSVSMSKQQYLAMIATAMGGRAAEELILGSDATSSGASSDFVRGTSIAEQMVSAFGFGPLGRVNLSSRNDRLSEATRQEVDNAVKSIVEEQYQNALTMLKEKKRELDRLAKGLVKYETLSYEEIKSIVNGEQLKRRD